MNRRNVSIGSAFSAVPAATTMPIRRTNPAAVPMSVERHPRTDPTPTTMSTISMTSTAAARPVVVTVVQKFMGESRSS